MTDLEITVENGCAGIDISTTRFLGERLFLRMFRSVGNAHTCYEFGADMKDWTLDLLTNAITGEKLCVHDPELLKKRYGFEPQSSTAKHGYHPVKIRIAIAGYEDYVEIKAEIENGGASPVRNIFADTCLQLLYADSFKGADDEALARTFIRKEGEWTSLIETRRSVQADLKMSNTQAYAAKEPQLSYPDGITPGLHRWNVSDDRFSEGIVALLSKDFKWCLGYTWQQTIAIGRNWDILHDCIHCDIGFGDILPGETVVRRGKIYFIEGNLDQLLEVYHHDKAYWSGN